MTTLIQGFLLGIANGGSCLATCTPVFLPYLVSEGRSIRHSIPPVLYFLAGRLAGYLLFALFAWEAGKLMRSEPRSVLFLGGIYAVLACILVSYGFSPQSYTCAAQSFQSRWSALLSRRPAIFPAALGLLTGLTLCPPFIAALAGAAGEASLPPTLLYFASFFIATSLYIAPFPFVGSLGRFVPIRTVGRLAAGVMGCYFFYRSLIMIYGGLKS